MNDLKGRMPDEKRVSAVDRGKLPDQERTAILGAQAALVETLYGADRRLAEFEAFGENDPRHGSVSGEGM